MNVKINAEALKKQIINAALKKIADEARKLGLKAVISNGKINVSGDEEKVKQLLRKFGQAENLIQQIKGN